MPVEKPQPVIAEVEFGSRINRRHAEYATLDCLVGIGPSNASMRSFISALTAAAFTASPERPATSPHSANFSRSVISPCSDQ